MQPWACSNDGVRERRATLRFGLVPLAEPDDRPVHLELKIGAFARGDNNPGTWKAVV